LPAGQVVEDDLGLLLDPLRVALTAHSREPSSHQRRLKNDLFQEGRRFHVAIRKSNGCQRGTERRGRQQRSPYPTLFARKGGDSSSQRTLCCIKRVGCFVHQRLRCGLGLAFLFLGHRLVAFLQTLVHYARFRSARALVSYVGGVPGLRQSGKHAFSCSRCRPLTNARLCHRMRMTTLVAVRINPWLYTLPAAVRRRKTPKVALVTCTHLPQLRISNGAASVTPERRPAVWSTCPRRSFSTIELDLSDRVCARPAASDTSSLAFVSGCGGQRVRIGGGGRGGRWAIKSRSVSCAKRSHHAGASSNGWLTLRCRIYSPAGKVKAGPAC
jgi:hypothetical protein